MEKGIEKIKEALLVTIETAEKVDDALSDDKHIDFFESLGIGIKAVKFIGVIKSSKELKEEFLDLTEQEKEEIITYVESELELSNPITEKKIENIFNALINLATEIFV